MATAMLIELRLLCCLDFGLACTETRTGKSAFSDGSVLRLGLWVVLCSEWRVCKCWCQVVDALESFTKWCVEGHEAFFCLSHCHVYSGSSQIALKHACSLQPPGISDLLRGWARRWWSSLETLRQMSATQSASASEVSCLHTEAWACSQGIKQL